MFYLNRRVSRRSHGSIFIDSTYKSFCDDISRARLRGLGHTTLRAMDTHGREQDVADRSDGFNSGFNNRGFPFLYNELTKDAVDSMIPCIITFSVAQLKLEV